MAERERFELSRRSSRLPACEAGAFTHSTTSPGPAAQVRDLGPLPPLDREEILEPARRLVAPAWRYARFATQTAPALLQTLFVGFALYWSVADWRADLVESRRRARAVTLVIVGLSERGNDKVGTFSKGMQQRLGLGVALLGQPELVILDEPTSALDPLGRHDVRDVIRELRASGTTVFLNTHLLEEAEQICDRVCVMDHGRSIATGTLAELVGRGKQFTRLDLGEP